MICFIPIHDQNIYYNILYRPNFTIAIDTIKRTRNDALLIEGNVTDWDSSNLTFNVLLNNYPIRMFNITKDANTASVPFSTNISLKTALLGENNLTIIVKDSDSISSNQTLILQVQGISPELSILSNDDTEYSKGDDINVTLYINQVDAVAKLYVYYSFDETDNWTLAKQFDMNNDVKLPFNVSFNIKQNLSEGNHSIKVKCIDSNGLESKKNPTMKFWIKKETTNIFTNIPSFSTAEPLNNQNFSTAQRNSIIIGAVVFIAVVIAIIIGAVSYAKCQKDDSSCQTASDDVKQILSIDMTVVIERDDHVVDCNESSNDFIDFNESATDFFDEEIESVLDASF